VSVGLKLPTKTRKVSWGAVAHTAGPILIASVVVIWLALYFVQPAPPRTLTIATGPTGSAFELAAERYRTVLARNGITLQVLPSQGSLDNLKRLSDPHSGVDIALVQSGIKQAGESADLESLGSMFYEPLMIFYRGAQPMARLSELRGKRVAVGPSGSGTRYIAQALLAANSIEADSTQLLSLEGEAARTALLKREADAIFLTGDSASAAMIRQMLHSDGIRLFDFARADAYQRRFPYLHKLVIPAGGFDLGEDLPAMDLNLLAPTVELLAHPSLHPALCDLLIEAAFEVHGRATPLQAAREFPKPIAHDFPLSSSAARYYKSGDRNLAYRFLPFWLASLVNRLIVMLVPLIVVVIPGLRYLPQLYRWRIDSRIHQRYGELMDLERESLSVELSDERRATLIERLNEIERSIIAHKTPGSHAEQLYLLRQHISFVRQHLSPETVRSVVHRELPLPPRRASSEASA
jgi:TRAP transporter TAXI family solute receptor